MIEPSLCSKLYFVEYYGFDLFSALMLRVENHLKTLSRIHKKIAFNAKNSLHFSYISSKCNDFWRHNKQQFLLSYLSAFCDNSTSLMFPSFSYNRPLVFGRPHRFFLAAEQKLNGLILILI